MFKLFGIVLDHKLKFVQWNKESHVCIVCARGMVDGGSTISSHCNQSNHLPIEHGKAIKAIFYRFVTI